MESDLHEDSSGANTLLIKTNIVRSEIAPNRCLSTASVIATLFVTCLCASALAGAPAVSQVHVISVHVKDFPTFDSVLLFFRDTIKLPLLYGEPSKPGDEGKTLYAGFSVGNAYLEPCGPYKSDSPFSPDQPARFHGLTFACAASVAVAARELDRRAIPHSGLIGGGTGPRFVYVTDGLLTGKRQAVSLWEIRDQNDRAHLGFVASSLAHAKGGPLGIRRIAEVRVRYPAKENLAQWDHLLAPAEHKADVWPVGNGPVLRLVPGQESKIESIVLDVESLEKAKAFLSNAGLLGQRIGDSIELDSAKTWGLRIVLRPQPVGR
jgi:hypothetical protein